MHCSPFLLSFSVLIIAIAGPIPTLLEQESANAISIRDVDSQIGSRLSIRAPEPPRQEAYPGEMQPGHAHNDDYTDDTGANDNGATDNGVNGNGRNANGGNYDGGNYGGENGVVDPVSGKLETDFDNIQPGQTPREPSEVKKKVVIIRGTTYTYPDGELESTLVTKGDGTPEIDSLLDRAVELLKQQVKKRLGGGKSSEGNGNGNGNGKNNQNGGGPIQTEEDFQNADEHMQKIYIWGIAAAILGEPFAAWVIANWAVFLPALLLL